MIWFWMSDIYDAYKASKGDVEEVNGPRNMEFYQR